MEFEFANTPASNGQLVGWQFEAVAFQRHARDCYVPYHNNNKAGALMDLICSSVMSGECLHPRHARSYILWGHLCRDLFFRKHLWPGLRHTCPQVGPRTSYPKTRPGPAHMNVDAVIFCLPCSSWDRKLGVVLAPFAERPKYSALSVTRLF